MGNDGVITTTDDAKSWSFCIRRQATSHSHQQTGVLTRVTLPAGVGSYRRAPSTPLLRRPYPKSGDGLPKVDLATCATLLADLGDIGRISDWRRRS